MSSQLSAAGIHKAFGSQAVLDDIGLEVAPGSLTAILGSSGSGKTTLLRILAGFDRPDSGTITIDGRRVDDTDTHVPPQHRSVGYVPQEGALFPHLTVGANVGFGLPRRQRKSRVAELLDLTALGHLSHRYPHQLSGGQQQRVALARALAAGPTLMLLDEPFSSLDASLRASVRGEVLRVLAAAGTTALLVTHDQDEALSMADTVAVLRGGRFAQCGPPEEVYARPADAQVAAFVGAANLLAGTPDGSRAHTALGPVALSAAPEPAWGDEVTVLVRPEQIDLVDPASEDGVDGTVRQCEYFGHDTVLTVELAAGAGGVPPALQPVQVRLAGRSPLRPGAAVRLRTHGPGVAWPT